MTEAEIAAIEARHADATPGEWVIGADDFIVVEGVADIAVMVEDSDSDAAFIMEAHNRDIPALIAEVRLLQRHWDETHCPDCGCFILSDHDVECGHWGKPEKQRETINDLLKTLGPMAIQALLEGKAAVVPLVPTSRQKRDAWCSDGMIVFNWPMAKNFWLRMIAAGRIDAIADQPPTPKLKPNIPITKEDAFQALVDRGFITESGKLCEEYGGPVRSADT